MSRSSPSLWPPFVQAAILLALTAGFGLGGALFALRASAAPLGLWWPAAAQVHGHVQLFGWSGLMVPGVGFHFVPGWAGRVTAEFAFYAFLIPISVAMSGRTFALYFRAPLPSLPALRIGLAFLLGGLGLRVGGELVNALPLAGLGRLLQAGALGTFVWALGIFAARRPLPRQPVRPLADPIQLHAISAYLWLIVTTAVLAVTGLTSLGAVELSAPADAERHALGAGFVSLLILGLAAPLLPGFAGRRAAASSSGRRWLSGTVRPCSGSAHSCWLPRSPRRWPTPGWPWRA